METGDRPLDLRFSYDRVLSDEDERSDDTGRFTLHADFRRKKWQLENRIDYGTRSLRRVDTESLDESYFRYRSTYSYDEHHADGGTDSRFVEVSYDVDRQGTTAYDIQGRVARGRRVRRFWLSGAVAASMGDSDDLGMTWQTSVSLEAVAEHFRRVRPRAGFHAGVSESGVPFGVSLGLSSKGATRLTWNISYGFSSSFQSKDRGSTQAHNFGVSVGFRVASWLSTYAGGSYGISETTNGHAVTTDTWNLNGGAKFHWDRTSASLIFTATHDEDDLTVRDQRYVTFLLTQRINRRLAGNVSAQWQTNTTEGKDIADNSYIKVQASLSASYRLATVSLSYSLSMIKDDFRENGETTDHTLRLEVSRAFHKSWR